MASQLFDFGIVFFESAVFFSHRDVTGEVGPPSCVQEPAAGRSRLGPLAGKVASGGEGLGSQIWVRFGPENVSVLPFPSPALP